MAANRGKKNVNPYLDESNDDFEFVNGDQLRHQIRQAQQRSLDSTKRSLALIEDSHDVACKTAEELEYQGEQLNRIERNLDIIHDDMQVANRHITSMKSIFGTVGNYFKRAPKQTASQQPAENPKQSLHGMTTAHAFEPSSSKTQQYEASTSSSYSSNQARQTQRFVSNDPYERQVNENLDLITKGLGRLKEDALILGNELDRQNAQLPRITAKTESADVKVEKAQKDIRKLLR